jgi:hypothetical protein
MGWKRQFLIVLLVALIVFDLGMLKTFYLHGWPSKMSGQSVGSGAVEINVTSLPLTAMDWLIITFFLCGHLLLIYGIWRTRRPHEHHS